MTIPSLSTIAEGTVVASFCGIVVRYVYRYIRNAEISQDFVYDMATNHLPHLYDALTQLCVKEGIDLGTPPPIRFARSKREDK